MKAAVLVFKSESTHGPMPVRAGGPPPIRGDITTGGDFEVVCACGGVIDTRQAAIRVTGVRGIQWSGVPCSGICGHTYTLEASLH